MEEYLWMTMRAVFFEEFQGKISIENLPTPEIKKHGVLIKVGATGLCRSDWHGWMGHDPDITLPHVPGHELAGTIELVGSDVRDFHIGERVTVPFVCGCGSCPQCNSGNHQVCDNQSQPGFTHWGSFAEYVTIDYADTNLVRLPEEIDDITAATLGCRFITSFRAIVDQGKVKEDQYVVIHGCGGVGLSAIMIAKAFGAHVIAIDIDDSTLALCTELGAMATINSLGHDRLVNEIHDLTKGGAHISIDALGSEETCINSIKNLRKRGKHIQVGLMSREKPVIPMDLVIAHELEIIGSHGMQAFRYPDMLNMILQNKLDPGQLITKTITLEESIDELTQMNEFKNPGVVVIDRLTT